MKLKPFSITLKIDHSKKPKSGKPAGSELDISVTDRNAANTAFPGLTLSVNKDIIRTGKIDKAIGDIDAMVRLGTAEPMAGMAFFGLANAMSRWTGHTTSHSVFTINHPAANKGGEAVLAALHEIRA